MGHSWGLQQSPTNTVEKIVLDDYFDPNDPVKIPATVSNKILLSNNSTLSVNKAML
jgi:hypothetical protein